MRDIQIGEIEAVRPDAWAIRGVIGGVSMVWGPSGNYKTFLGISMSVAVASGRPWFGCQVRQGPVLYILGEGGLDLFRRRAGMAAEYFNVPIMDLPLWVRAEALDMSNPHKLAPYLSAWDAISPVLVVIDTVSRCLPGDENKQEIMQGFVSSMDALKDRYECTVLALHHAGKDGEVRGSTVLPGAVDVSLEVKRFVENEKKKLNIRPDKLRDLDTDNFVNTQLLAESREVRDSHHNLVLDEYGDKITTLVLKTEEDYSALAESVKNAFSALTAERTAEDWVGYSEWIEQSKMTSEKFKKGLNEVLLQPERYGIVSPERGQYVLSVDFDPHANPLEKFAGYGSNFDVDELTQKLGDLNDVHYDLKEEKDEV